MNHHPDKMDELPNHMALAAAMSAAAGGQGKHPLNLSVSKYCLSVCHY